MLVSACMRLPSTSGASQTRAYCAVVVRFDGQRPEVINGGHMQAVQAEDRAMHRFGTNKAVAAAEAQVCQSPISPVQREGDPNRNLPSSPPQQSCEPSSIKVMTCEVGRQTPHAPSERQVRVPTHTKRDQRAQEGAHMAAWCMSTRLDGSMMLVALSLSASLISSAKVCPSKE